MSVDVEFEHVKLKNFMSYEEETIPLGGTGVTVIHGVNQDNPAMVSNGAGKTGIRKSIEWGLFGKTSDKLDGEDIVNHSASGKGTMVETAFKAGDETYVVTRYQDDSEHGNALFFEDSRREIKGATKAATQKYINQTLGMDWETFTAAITAGAETPFSAMTDAPQKGLLEALIGVTELEKAARVVKEDMDTAVAELRNVNQEYDTKKRELMSVCEQIEDLEKGTRLWSKTQAAELKEFEGQRTKWAAEIERLSSGTPTSQVGDLTVRIDALEVSLSGQKQAEEQYERFTGLAAEALQLRHSLDRETRALAAEYGALQDMPDGQPCPTCTQEVKQSNLEERINELIKQAHDKRGAFVEADELSMKLATKRDRWRAKKRELAIDASTLKELLKVRREQERALDTLASTLKSLRDGIAGIDTQIIQHHAKIDPYAKMHEKLEQQRKAAEAEVSQLHIKEHECSLHIQDLAFWVKGFGNQGIRSYMLDQFIPVLNKAVRDYSDTLTDGQLDIRFTNRTKLADGTVKEKFQVEVFNLHGANSYRGNSGGERDRVDLAVWFALNDLLCVRKNRRIGLLFLDEILKFSDPAAWERAATLIRRLAKTRRIFLVTNNPMFDAQFPHAITVVKKEGISHLA